MSYALTRLTGDGSTQIFTIGFNYRDKADITVKVDGVAKVLTTDFTFHSDSQIRFNTAPANDAAIVIRRSTSQSTRLVDYAAGAVFKESDLDTDSTQGFFMAQESIDIANDSITKNDSNQYDAENTRIINLAEPTASSDAATKSYVQTFANSYNSRYYGQSATAPTDPAPSEGDLWWDSTNNMMKVHNGTGWQDATSRIALTSNRVVYTVGTNSGTYTGSTTTFPATYDAGFVDVFLNGSKLIHGTDFTATNGTSVVLSTAASSGDKVDIVAQGAAVLTETNFLPLSGGTLTGDVSLGDNVKTKFGNSDELQIYHTGSSALIQESGDGDLGILGANIVIANADASKNYIGCTDNANVTLFYNGNPKLNTVASGIEVTGTVTFDGLSGTGSVNVTDILDEDDMSSNSATALATQQSIKAYVDANAGGIALTDISVSGTEGTASGDGGIGYDNTTGVFTYTPPDLSSYLTSFDITEQTDPKYLRSDADDTTTGTITAAGLIVDTDTLYVDTANNKVGIGTTTPGGALTVKSSGFSQLRLEDDDDKLEIGYSGAVAYIKTGDDDSVINFRKNNNTDVMTVDMGNERLGIGTTSPDSLLHLESASAPTLKIDDSDSTYALELAQDGSNGSMLLGSAGVLTIGVTNNSSSDTVAFQTKSTERMRIDADGNVGIGTASPNSKLHVNGVLTTTANPIIKKNVPTIEFRSPDGTNGMNIKANLNNTNNYGLQIEDVNALNKVVVGPTGDVSFYNETSDSTAKFRWDASTERLGIGTDSPSTALDVNGTVTATAFSGDGSALTGLPAGGISNVVEDTTPQLGGDLDAQDNEINNVDKLGINTSSPSVACDVQFTKTSDLVAGLRVHTSAATSFDGKVITWGEQTAERGVLGWADGMGLDSCYIASGIAGLRFQREFGSSPRIVPCDSNGAKRDNSIDLGQSNARFDDVYATNGSIITSDRNLKQDIESLTDAEQRVAVAVKGLLRKFRWRDAVEEKGDEARIHFGVIAQDLQDAFTAEGLDATKYAMFCSNTWWEHEGEIYPTSDSAPEGATEVTRLGVRYSELLAFIISAI